MKKVAEKHYTVKHKDSGYDKKLFVRKYEQPNGIIGTFIVDDGSDSVQIFPITKDQKVITVLQFRPGSEAVETELPGGGIEKGENHERGAYRELLEETGHKGNLTYLGSTTYSPYSTGRRHMYLATGCEKVAKLDLDPNEFLTVKLWPLEMFRDLMKKGQVRGTDLSYMALDKLGLLT
ncbi:MAG: NUDIX hydrolase [Candidatus Paceibacterota bacterium]|jgi:ADP-ribose pyrophosphatase